MKIAILTREARYNRPSLPRICTPMIAVRQLKAGSGATAAVRSACFSDFLHFCISIVRLRDPETMTKITLPSQPQIRELIATLGELSVELDRSPQWPSVQLHQCQEAGVPAWFVSAEHGGCGWTGSQVTEGLFALGQGCLTTTFIYTQQIAAYRRIAHSPNPVLSDEFLTAVAEGRRTATVGISHLTTSRQHLKGPALLRGPAWQRIHPRGFLSLGDGCGTRGCYRGGCSVE